MRALFFAGRYECGYEYYAYYYYNYEYHYNCEYVNAYNRWVMI